MEILVVLVLAGMISTLLIQGFSYVLSLRIRFIARLEEQTVTVLQSHWLTRITAGLQPCRPVEAMPFSGEATRFQGLSISALMGEPGIPVPVTLEWRFEEGSIMLQYREGRKEPMEIGRWLGDPGADKPAAFTYFDEQGNRHKEWPPSMGTFPQLPKAILFQAQTARGPVSWLVPLPGRPDPKPTMKELFSEP